MCVFVCVERGGGGEGSGKNLGPLRNRMVSIV